MALKMYDEFIKSVLKEASRIASEKFGKVVGSIKTSDNNQVLTEADLEIGSLIIGRIKETFPEHNIIDEEAGAIDNKSDFTWVIDPIDGTSNFANGLPNYGIMLGVQKEDIPLAGGIVLPFFKEVYTAEKGNGSFCNGSRIHVTSEQKLSNCLVAYQIDGHQENPERTQEECRFLPELILNIRNLRGSGSVFDPCMVASGKYGAILNQTSKIWDNIAQQIIIEEAGGIYTDFYGKPIDYSRPIQKADDNFTYCASSKIIHEQIMSIINKYYNV